MPQSAVLTALRVPHTVHNHGIADGIFCVTARVRPARPEEAPAIAALSRELVERGLAWRWTAARVRRVMADRESNVIVARRRGCLAGFALMRYHEERAHLMLFAVDAAHQRAGVGRALWAWLEVTLRTAGITAVSLEVRAQNTAARAFYRALGFCEGETLRRYYGGVEPAIRMQCHLAAVAPPDKA